MKIDALEWPRMAAVLFEYDLCLCGENAGERHYEGKRRPFRGLGRNGRLFVD